MLLLTFTCLLKCLHLIFTCKLLTLVNYWFFKNIYISLIYIRYNVIVWCALFIIYYRSARYFILIVYISFVDLKVSYDIKNYWINLVFFFNDYNFIIIKNNYIYYIFDLLIYDYNSEVNIMMKLKVQLLK